MRIAAARRFVVVALLLLIAVPAWAGNWPQWRGPTGDSVCPEPTVPLTWGEGKNVAWTCPLPDGASTPGRISVVGTVASGTAGNATIPVTVTLTRPSAAGTFDQAPVTVYITTASAKNVLAVPVTALLAQPSGGYVVEVAGPGNTRRWVPVQAGPVFDDADGLVQVAGDLVPGQRVVVPAS